jgi:Methyltransferase domain
MNRLALFLKRLLDRSVIRVLRYIDQQLHIPREPLEDVIVTVKRRAADASAVYIEQHLDEAMIFRFRSDVWDHALSKVTLDGLYAEFGVANGDSINHIADVVRAKGVTVHGFDSFEGLKEDWHGTWYRAGHFSRDGNLPAVPANVTLHKGWFDATIPSFLAAHPGPFAFVHLDADTYESTTTLLDLLGDRIVSGTVIVMDEYVGFPNWQKGEFRAWQDFIAARGLRYRYLAFSNTPAAVQIL